MYMLVCDCMCMYLQAQTSEEIDAVSRMKLKVLVLDEDLNYVTNEVPYVSAEIRAMVDNMLFLSAYGHKSMFESDRTRQEFRKAFAQYSLQAANDNEAIFYSSWKEYRVSNPTVHTITDPAAGGVVDIDRMLGDDDDDEPLFGGAPAAPAPPADAAVPAAAAAAAAADAAAAGNSDSD